MSREQRMADFRAGAKWCAMAVSGMEALQQEQRARNEELSRLMDAMDHAAGIRDFPLGPTDRDIERALGLPTTDVEEAARILVPDWSEIVAREIKRQMDEEFPRVAAKMKEALLEMVRERDAKQPGTALEVTARIEADAEMRREVRRRFCERILLYRIAEWMSKDLLNPPLPLANALVDLLACGEPWQHPDYEVAPPAKEEPK